MTAEDIIARFEQEGYSAKHVVITGGEPAMFDLLPLGKALEAKGYQLQIETSGTFELK